MQLRNSHLQRIHWAIYSPSLLSHPFTANYIRDTAHEQAVNALLKALDAESTAVDEHFAPLGHIPMGKYFEQLLFFLLERDPRYEVVLRNHQVIENGRTIGELDILLRDTVSGQLEHWEVCVKFYLKNTAPDAYRNIIGPNAKDRLHRKFRKLIDHQLPLSKHPRVAQLFSGQTIENKLFMKGHLFNHFKSTVAFPSVIHPAVEKGWWCYLHEATDNISSAYQWAIVNKPHWIGRYQTNNSTELLDSVKLKDKLLEHFDAERKSVLVAGMTTSETGWMEQTRGFVVNSDWPRINQLV